MQGSGESVQLHACTRRRDGTRSCVTRRLTPSCFLFGACGYYTFGDITPSNIIDAYPNNAPVAVARVGLSLVVIFSYPIMVFGVRLRHTHRSLPCAPRLR